MEYVIDEHCFVVHLVSVSGNSAQAVLVGLLATMMVAKRLQIVTQSDVEAVAFADERQVIAGDVNGDIRRWKIEDGQQQGPIMQARSRILAIVVSQDGRWSGHTEREEERRMRAPPTLDSWKDVYLLPRLSLSAELCTDPENPVPLALRHLYSPWHPGTPVSPSAVLALPAPCHPSVPTTSAPYLYAKLRVFPLRPFFLSFTFVHLPGFL
ncbi:hypothetical protein EDC04DRAFT_3139607 [Pisolithus marmoratus]|nr:hypothetical protein EDC04DRAFT_3139607 [Pisolithus marmoratus]